MDIQFNRTTGFPKAISDTPDNVKLLAALGQLVRVRNDAAYAHLNSPRTYDPAKWIKSIAAATEQAAGQFRKCIPGPETFDGFRTAYHGNRAVRFRDVLWVLFEADELLGMPMTIRPVLETAMCRVRLSDVGMLSELGDPDAGVDPVTAEPIAINGDL